MSPDEVNKALGVLGIVGVMGAFLPSIDTAWDADPDGGNKKLRVRTGARMYLLSAFALGALAAYGQRSLTPLLLCVALAIGVVAMYEHALVTKDAAG